MESELVCQTSDCNSMFLRIIAAWDFIFCSEYFANWSAGMHTFDAVTCGRLSTFRKCLTSKLSTAKRKVSNNWRPRYWGTVTVCSCEKNRFCWQLHLLTASRQITIMNLTCEDVSFKKNKKWVPTMSWSPISTFKRTVSYITFLFYLMQVEVDCAFVKDWWGSNWNVPQPSVLYRWGCLEIAMITVIIIIIIIIIIIGLTRQQTTLYQHAQYWQKKST